MCHGTNRTTTVSADVSDACCDMRAHYCPVCFTRRAARERRLRRAGASSPRLCVPRAGGRPGPSRVPRVVQPPTAPGPLAAGRPASPAVRARDARRHAGAAAAARVASSDGAPATAGVAAGPRQAPDAPIAGWMTSRPGWAASAERRPGGLSRVRSRWPACSKRLRACLRGRGESLRGRTRRRPWRGSGRAGDPCEPSVSSFCQAWVLRPERLQATCRRARR